VPIAPIATYRIQLTPSFGFDAARAIVPDLALLGISHLYLSPVAEAVTGSTHGYDVVDPATVRAELGGEDALRELARAARRHGLGIVIDIVPNHVSTAEPERNAWWWTLLRDGARSSTSSFFDVDWEQTGGRVLLPVLGRPLGETIAAGELDFDDDRVRYYGRAFPLRRDRAASDPAELLEQQHYRLEHWRAPERNVRRFFTIDDLVAIRPEVSAVADAVHGTVRSLAGDELLDGVRVDHIDGLADPAGYLQTLRSVIGDRWLLVEKILVGDERLPAEWVADGTTGYEWIALIDHLFTHPAGERPLTELWETTSGEHREYHELEAAGVRHVLETALRPDLERVARVAGRLLEVAPERLIEPLIELTVGLGRYRTYLDDRGDTQDLTTSDARLLGRVAGRSPDRSELTAQLVDAILAGNELTRRWQQLTGPALAKGGEDGALYRWFRLAAHNEVGGDPGRWTTSIDEFHRRSELAARLAPSSMLASSTHDTKRSEDARARLLVLAEIPNRWRAAVAEWRGLIDAPDGASMLFALQTAVAAWPLDADRLGEYLVKSAREAGNLTSWTDPDDDHEGALRLLADRLVTEPLAASVGALIAEIEPAAHAVALAQLVLRLTAPGVPDLYQGSEDWLHTLVDPDNRGPIEPGRLASAVAAANHPSGTWTSSAPKAAVIARTLGVRRRHAHCFSPGSGYLPLPATGHHRDHLIAFARLERGGRTGVVAVAARFPLSRPDGWRDTTLELPAGAWVDALGGGTFEGAIAVDELLVGGAAAVLEPAP
jgi:(1->4)-alpha-D-glucan 1-alpha-D-glucosylmutase